MLQWNDAVVAYIQTHAITDVVLIARWTVYVEGTLSGKSDMLLTDGQGDEASRQRAADVFERSLRRTIERLVSCGARVWIVREVPSQPYNPGPQFLLAKAFGLSEPQGASLEWNLVRHRIANDVIDRHQSDDVHVLDPWPFCFDEQGNSIVFDGQRTLYFDDNHLSAYGAEKLMQEFVRLLLLQIKQGGGQQLVRNEE